MAGSRSASHGTISGSGLQQPARTYTLDGNRLNLGPPGGTTKACPATELPEQEAGYLSALESAVRVDRVGSELTLLDASGQMAVTLTRK